MSAERTEGEKKLKQDKEEMEGRENEPLYKLVKALSLRKYIKILRH